MVLKHPIRGVVSQAPPITRKPYARSLPCASSVSPAWSLDKDHVCGRGGNANIDGRILMLHACHGCLGLSLETSRARMVGCEGLCGREPEIGGRAGVQGLRA